MKANATYIRYEDTHSFSNLVIDYVNEEEHLTEFISDFPSDTSIQKQIQKKQLQPIDRKTLQYVLKEQYSDLAIHENVQKNIELLNSETTFTICTAHQPTIFTGYLYFIYKIIHAIKLSKECKALYPLYDFVPVYYMGSEDNDIDEIGTFHYNNKTYTWNTKQTGACGRMHTYELNEMIIEINQTLNANNLDEKLLSELFLEAYNGEHTLAEATRILVNTLLGAYGLLIIDGDDKNLKKMFKQVIKQEILEQNSEEEVRKAIEKLSKKYKVQANPRAINLFYLNGNIRERIEFKENQYHVLNTTLRFSKVEIENEIELYPERFSPNVILRPLYQETILPNIAFIGGGGELAYWLELKTLFEKHSVVYPLIFLRNSVLWIQEKTNELINKLSLPLESVFLSKESMFKLFILKGNTLQTLNAILGDLELKYESIVDLGAAVSPDLEKSIKAHRAKSKRIVARIVQKFNAQLKRKEVMTLHKIEKIKNQIEPNGNLQERYDNFLSIYKLLGVEMFEILCKYQQGFGKEFLILNLSERAISE